jgi:hypothetical protein
MKIAAGTYEAKVVGATLEILTSKTDQAFPILKVSFEAKKHRSGSVFVDCDPHMADKIYFLSTETATGGAQAGRSKIEILRDDLDKTFDFKGSLDDEGIKSLIGKLVEIVVEYRGEFPQVKWVNKIGGKKIRAVKAIPPDIMKKLKLAFAGVPVDSTKPLPASDFFKKMQVEANAE